MFRLVFKEPVYVTLEEAYRWYEEQLPGLGERLLEEINTCFDKLSQTPFYYSISRENYRHLTLKHFPYKIVFEIAGEDVIVYTLFHTSRNPDKMFE